MTVHIHTSTSQALLALFSSTDSGTPIPLTTVGRGAPIIVFCGDRETSLWLLDNVFFFADARPVEFRSVAELTRGEAGVRVRTAMGRTSSVVLVRCGCGSPGEHGVKEDGGEGDEGERSSR